MEREKDLPADVGNLDDVVDVQCSRAVTAVDVEESSLVGADEDDAASTPESLAICCITLPNVNLALQDNVTTMIAVRTSPAALPLVNEQGLVVLTRAKKDRSKQ